MLHCVLVALGSIVFLFFAAWHITFYYEWRWLFRRSDCKKINKMPGPKPIPFFGNIFLFNIPQEELIPQLVRLYKEYGPTYRLWIMGFPEVLVTDPDDVEVILSSPTHITKSLDYLLLQPWLGTGLLTSAGNKWHTRRKLFTPTFHFKILEEYLKVFNSNSQILVEKLGAQVGKPFVEIISYITMCTLDIICETAMGISVHAQIDGEAEYIRAVERMKKLIVKRQFTPWLHKDLLYYSSPFGREERRLLQIIHGFTDQVIRERREGYKTSHHSEGNSKPRRRMAFLDLLIEMSENEKLLSDADIREEVDTFMFEGHDTTSVAISWAMYLLGSHPEIQERVVDELNSIFGGSDREATLEDVQQMKYLEQVIKETLRLYPSVPAFSRILDVDLKIKNYTVPAGTQTPIIPFLIHRNPEVFPNPEEFNPDNFLPEKVQKRHRFAYIPFSAGPRNCIGQKFAMLEEKIVLSSVLRKLRLESIDRREDMPLLLELILRPKNGLRIKISRR